MPPRILIFVALSGDGPRAAAGAACELASPGSARPLSLDPAQAAPVLLRAADRLADNLDLRPAAWEIAVLARITTLLRERPDATIVIEAAGPGTVVRLLEAADLARARLNAGRPHESTSTLAAQRAARMADLPALRAAAAAGDLLRAPELTSVGLIAGPAAAGAAADAARGALAFAGLTVVPEPLPSDPATAALALAAAGGTAALARDPAPVITATGSGAELTLPLPAVPADLRAVRSGRELVLQAGGAVRRLTSPASLGPLVAGEITAGDDGTVVAQFAAAPEGPA